MNKIEDIEEIKEMEFGVYNKDDKPVTYDLHNRLKNIFPWEEIPGEVGDIKIVYNVNGAVVDLNYNGLGTTAQFYIFDENLKKFFEEKTNVKLKNLENIK